MMGQSRGLALWMLAAFAAIGLSPALSQTTPAAKPGAPEIDVKLFEKTDKAADRSRGCTVTLWQANRNPEQDKYAIVFNEQLRGKDHARDPAHIRIGTANVPLTRIAVGGKTEGYGLYPYQLYRMADGEGYVVLDLKLGELEGEAIEIESGKIMISMLGKEAFRASVKGGAGCMGAPLPLAGAAPKAAAPPAPAPTAAKLPPGPAMFERHKVDPAYFSPGFRREVEKKFGCNPQVMRVGVTGYSLSEESAIWEIPCDRFAYQASSVFALVYVAAPEKEHRYLDFSTPKGITRSNAKNVLMSPQWDIKTRTVTGISLGRAGGDCGVYEKYRVTPEGNFALVEYRDKPDCDGKSMAPEQFPLVFPR